jgi:sulfonate transport system permease protein
MSVGQQSLEGSVSQVLQRLPVLLLRRRLVPVLSVAGFIATWGLVAHLGAWAPYLLPSPQAAGSALLRELTSGRLAENFADSFHHYALGLAWGVSGGVIVGMAVAWFRTLELLVMPVLLLLRPIPVLAWIPFAILWFHITHLAAAFIISIASFYITFFATYGGIRNIDRRLLDVAQTLGTNSDLGLIRRVVLPAALPSILTGIHTSLGQAWLAVVAAELFGVRGLGLRMTEAAGLLAMDVVVAYMAVLGLIYLVTDFGFRLVEARLLRWR